MSGRLNLAIVADTRTTTTLVRHEIKRRAANIPPTFFEL